MFLSKLVSINSLVPRQKVDDTKTQITVKPYVDPFLDTVGWYALGHHDRQQFLSVVIKQERYPYHNIDHRQVQLTWAKFDGNGFELVPRKSENAQPITLIEIW